MMGGNECGGVGGMIRRGKPATLSTTNPTWPSPCCRWEGGDWTPELWHGLNNISKCIYYRPETWMFFKAITGLQHLPFCCIWEGTILYVYHVGLNISSTFFSHILSKHGFYKASQIWKHSTLIIEDKQCRMRCKDNYGEWIDEIIMPVWRW
jgi:hypothetical protein